MPRSTGMYESGLMYQLKRLFQTRSTSPIPGLVRLLVHFCLFDHGWSYVAEYRMYGSDASPALVTF